MLPESLGNTSKSPLRVKDHGPLVTRVEISNLTMHDKQDNEKGLPLMSEEEMNQYLELYASVDIEMDDKMVDEDDLLDEMEDEEAAVPETQEMVTPTKQGRLLVADKEVERPEKIMGRSDRQGKGQNSKPQRDKPTSTYPNKRRAARSLDLKGLAASKKLASRGKGSPKGKMAKQGRTGGNRGARTALVPRFEVYPSVVKNRKNSSASGSVGSQKPSSTHI